MAHDIAAAGSRTAGESAAPLTPEPLMRLGFGFWGSKVLMSAVELGVFAALVPGPLDADRLGAKVGLHPRARRDFLDALVSLDLLEREDGQYRNTPLTARFLDPALPAYVGGMAALCNDRLYPDWAHLSTVLRTGRPLRETGSDEDTFTAIYRVEGSAEQFARAMTGASLGLGRMIAGAFPWDRYRTFADVGCAEGGVAVQIALAHQHLAGIGLDLSPIKPIFERYVASFGLGDRLRFQTGDITAVPIPSADVVLLGHMLHGLDLDGKRALLAKAYAALPEGGALIVFDMVIDDDRRQHTLGLLMSLNMLIQTAGGFDYTAAEGIGWLREAGFREARVEPLPGPQSLVIGIK